MDFYPANHMAINVNTARKWELLLINNIGHARAERILQFRALEKIPHIHRLCAIVGVATNNASFKILHEQAWRGIIVFDGPTFIPPQLQPPGVNPCHVTGVMMQPMSPVAAFVPPQPMSPVAAVVPPQPLTALAAVVPPQPWTALAAVVPPQPWTDSAAVVPLQQLQTPDIYITGRYMAPVNVLHFDQGEIHPHPIQVGQENRWQQQDLDKPSLEGVQSQIVSYPYNQSENWCNSDMDVQCRTIGDSVVIDIELNDAYESNQSVPEIYHGEQIMSNNEGTTNLQSLEIPISNTYDQSFYDQSPWGRAQLDNTEVDMAVEESQLACGRLIVPDGKAYSVNMEKFTQLVKLYPDLIVSEDNSEYDHEMIINHQAPTEVGNIHQQSEDLHHGKMAGIDISQKEDKWCGRLEDGTGHMADILTTCQECGTVDQKLCSYTKPMQAFMEFTECHECGEEGQKLCTYQKLMQTLPGLDVPMVDQIGIMDQDERFTKDKGCGILCDQLYDFETELEPGHRVRDGIDLNGTEQWKLMDSDSHFSDVWMHSEYQAVQLWE